MSSTHNTTFRALQKWRPRWTKTELAIAIAGLFVFLATFSLVTNRQEPKPPSGFTTTSGVDGGGQRSDLVPFVLLTNAQAKGALCLDGSVPGYHFQKGFGSGSSSWLLHIEGGGWCNTIASCSYRKTTPLGSSRNMDHLVQFHGILSRDPASNPDFFNWNKVKIRYCDGGSFSGRRDVEFENGTKLLFRGQLIWETIMEELLALGLSSAKEAFLTGCSAGGLATLIHCDGFRKVLPKDANVKCLSDAGFFLNEEDISGSRTIESFYHDVVNLQGAARSLDEDCVSKVEPSKCFFPQHVMRSIKTPVFTVNPAYDFWQIRNILVPDASDPNGSWAKCKLNIHSCSASQIEVLHDFRNSLLKTLAEFQMNKEVGLFINSCYIHCQTWIADTWHSPNSPRINNKTIAEAVGDWFFNRREAKLIDCPYPCNPTCYNMNFN